MAGYLGGSIKGISTSTDAKIEIDGFSDLDVYKESGEDYWYYSRPLPAGEYDVTARDVTPDAGGNHDTKGCTIVELQFTPLNFDIS